MTIKRREVLAAVAGAGSIAGCLAGDGGDAGGTGDDDGSDGGTASPTPSPSDDGGGASVAVSDHPDLGEILVDGEDTTLYMFDSDTAGAGESACYDDCADAWPPLTTDGEPAAGGDVTAALDAFERETGEQQVTAGGWPLYYFASDEAPGDAAGQGVNDVWWVLRPDGSPVRTAGTESPTDEEAGGDDSYY